MADDKAAEELVQFLRMSAKPELKIAAMDHLSGMMSETAGVLFILKHKDLLEAVLSLLKDKIEPVVDNAYKAIINISAHESAAKRITSDYDIITDLISTISDPKSRIADEACKILNNLTRTENDAREFLRKCRKDLDNTKKDEGCLKSSKLKDLIEIFCKTKVDGSGASLDHIASVLANITQTTEGRALLLDRDDPVIRDLLPYLKHDSSLVRRRGISMTFKNCCFEYDHHEWLLGEHIEILPRLLLPLAGPEEFDEDENNSLLLDLQYLPDDKEREPDAAIRITLMESLFLLCADKFGRKFLQDSGTYYIIRELHNWETEHGPEENGDQCENLVQILIADEPETGMENLMTIPKEKLKALQERPRI